MMKRVLVVPALALVALTAAVPAAKADLDQDKVDCRGTNYELIIPSCTRLIDNRKKIGQRDLIDAYYYRSNEYIRLSQYDEGLADAQKCLSLNAKDKDCINQVGRVYLGKYDYVKALEFFQKTVKLDSKYITGWANIAYTKNQQGFYDEAIETYNRVLTLDPKYTWAYSSRGDAYSNKEEYDKALADYQKASLIDPNYIYARTGAGYCYRKLGQFDKALEETDKAVTIDANYAYAFALKGLIAFDQGQFGPAKAAFDQAINLQSTTAWYYAYRGIASTMLKQRDIAKSDLDKAITMSPGYIEAYYFLGLWHEQGGNKPEASKAYRESLKATASTGEARSAQEKALKRLSVIGG